MAEREVTFIVKMNTADLRGDDKILESIGSRFEQMEKRLKGIESGARSFGKEGKRSFGEADAAAKKATRSFEEMQAAANKAARGTAGLGDAGKKAGDKIKDGFDKAGKAVDDMKNKSDKAKQSMEKLAFAAKVGLASAGASILGQSLSSSGAQIGGKGGAALDIAGGALSGAAGGATAGAVLGPAGAAVGAFAGALAGAIPKIVAFGNAAEGKANPNLQYYDPSDPASFSAEAVNERRKQAAIKRQQQDAQRLRGEDERKRRARERDRAAALGIDADSRFSFQIQRARELREGGTGEQALRDRLKRLSFGQDGLTNLGKAGASEASIKQASEALEVAKDLTKLEQDKLRAARETANYAYQVREAKRGEVILAETALDRAKSSKLGVQRAFGDLSAGEQRQVEAIDRKLKNKEELTRRERDAAIGKYSRFLPEEQISEQIQSRVAGSPFNKLQIAGQLDDKIQKATEAIDQATDQYAAAMAYFERASSRVSQMVEKVAKAADAESSRLDALLTRQQNHNRQLAGG